MKLLQPIKLIKNINGKVYKGIPLSLLLVVPLVIHIFGAVALVGHLSLKNCHYTVAQLANELTDKVSNTVVQHLDTYLATPNQINQLNVRAIKQGRLDLHNSEDAGHYFWEQLQVFGVSHINYRLITGEFIEANRWIKGQDITIKEVSDQNTGKAYSYATDSQGNRRKALEVYDEKPRSEGWYVDTLKAGNPVWSPVYTRKAASEITTSIAANYPIYDQNNKIIGATSSALNLDDLTQFLRNLKVSSSGKVFVIERNGLLIADSSREKPFHSVNGKIHRLNALNSSDRTLQATAKYLQHKFGNFREIKDSQRFDFQSHHERHVVRVQPWRDKFGLDWLVIVVVPESDFMAEVHATSQVIVVLILVALLAATSLGLTISRSIIRPIHRLSKASLAIANGELDQNVEIKGVKELGLLSRCFNQMSFQLKESFEHLETRVEQRTVELNEAKQAAETANRAKSEFLANMSHELRTPLNAILGFTQVMNRDLSLKPDQQENLGIINRSGEHLLSLINDVLDMSKIESGRIVLTENAFDLYRLLDTIQEMFQLKAQSKGLQLLIERTPAVPQYVQTDESKLRQILINLLGNAIKFTQTGGAILRVSVVSDKSQMPYDKSQITLHFEVEDTGAGIAADEMENLFEPFVQTETGRKSQQGTGLGLPISRKFVQLMGGDITVNSILGQGTIFQFDTQVKLAKADDLQLQQTQRVLGLEPGQPEYRILVVDDRPENRQLLAKLLIPMGFEVQEAQNGQEAIALWSSWEPHLIWMDMRMPVMNGYEATKQIKSHLQGQATAIIALTASVLEEEQAIVLGAGCDDFVRKPFKEEVIWEKMAQYLGVRYVYAEDEVESIKDATTSDFLLQPISLQVMPAEWVEKLHYATTELNANQVLALIAQIPEKYSPLAKALQHKVNNFDFDQILNLTQYITVS